MRKKINHLYKSFEPEQYDINLKIDDKKLLFSGITVIHGTKKGAPNKRIVFHSVNLDIKTAKVNFESKSGPVSLKVSRINIHKSFNELRLHFDQLIYPGKYKIEIEYSGKITTQMEGIYPSYYSKNGKEQKLIATQFESHHARDVFPCIDEPEAKAVFNLELNTSNFNSIISNTEIHKQKKINNRLYTVFNTTPKMSTYLLAFVIGNMKFLESKTKDGIKVRCYATEAHYKNTKFALDVAVKSLEFFTDYYGIAFPLPKCDLIALPDFASGAMENWGCVTFREQALITDNKYSSRTIKQYVANVVAHELAHQWFGNLVTMKWWNDLWLNESFASWMSYKAVDGIFPEWKVWTQFIVDEQEKAMLADALEFTHPIEVPINHPDEIRTIFDAISYEKGASIIAMLNSYLGDEVFQRGINLYLKKHAYGNSETEDLWSSLEEASNKNVSAFIKPWTTTGGFPLVKASFVDQDVKLSQKRFYINPKAKIEENIWPVPIYIKEKDKSSRLFYRKSVKVDSSYISKSNLLNKNRDGFYRLIYSDKYLSIILFKSLPKLNPIDQMALLSDHVESAKAGYTTTIQALKIMEKLKNSKDLIVWEIIASFIGSIRSTMRDENLRESLKPHVRKLIFKELKRLGIKENFSDTYFDKLLRPLILSIGAAADEPKILKYCKESFKKGDIEPDYRSFIFATIARNGSAKEYNSLFKLYKKTINPEEKLNLTAALCAFKQPELVKKSLELIKSSDVKPQDAFYWIAYLLMNYYGRDLAWQWFKDNWDWLEDNFKNDLSFSRAPLYVARCFSEKDFINEYKDFFSRHSDAGLERSINQGIETIEWQSAWRERDLSLIKRYFS